MSAIRESKGRQIVDSVDSREIRWAEEARDGSDCS